VLGAVEQEFAIGGHGGSYAQAFSGPVVDLIGNGVKLLLAVAREIGALGQVLAFELGLHLDWYLMRERSGSEIEGWHAKMRSPSKRVSAGSLQPAAK
jgi:hypothetical protein